MPLVSSLIRRAIAALMTCAVLVAPATQLAHAEAMGHGADCTHGALSHAAMPGHQSQHRHQHDASCCEFCMTGSEAAVLPAPLAAIPAVVVVAFTHRPSSSPARVASRAPHLLPFSLAPPAPAA